MNLQPPPIGRPPLPPQAPPPLVPRNTSLRIRTGGPALDAVLQKSLETLEASEDGTGTGSAAPVLAPRVVEVGGVVLTIMERTAPPAPSTASFAIAHRALPNTDLTGLILWPCALKLAGALVRPAGALQRLACVLGRPLRVVELGAGTGIVGLTVAAALGEDAEVVALTDAGAPLGGGRTTVDVLTETIGANGHTARRASAARLIWGDANGAAALRSAHGGGPFDVAIGSELLYANNCAALALAASIEALGAQLVVLGQQTRPTGEAGLEDVFSARMISAGFAATRTPLGGTAVMHTFERRLPGAEQLTDCAFDD